MTLTVSGSQPLPQVAHVDPPRLTAGLDRAERLDLVDHVSMHGPMPTLTAPELLTSPGGSSYGGVAVRDWLLPTARRAVEMCPALAIRIASSQYGEYPRSSPAGYPRPPSTRKRHPSAGVGRNSTINSPS
jgi:hypothetical protein